MKLTVAIAKGRILKKFQELMIQSSTLNHTDFDTRKLVVYDDLNQIEYIILKPTDIPVYVEKGIADLGIVGNDVLMEADSELYEVMNFDFAKCKVSIAGFEGMKESELLKVATKYPNITQKYFDSIGQKVEVIKLNGSVELAPLIGLSDIIVDIVETGSTLKANGLSIIKDLYDISAKMVSNKISYRMKYDQIQNLILKINNK